MGPKLVDYLTYEPEESGILWIKFNRPDRLNALVGSAEENGTVAKVGEYMRAGDDDPNIRVIVLTGVGRVFCAGADLRSRAPADVTFSTFPATVARMRARMRRANISIMASRSFTVTSP